MSQPPPAATTPSQAATSSLSEAHKAASAEVVRAPLAVPMAHQAGRAGGFATMPRLGSLRATPDLSLGGPTLAPKPAFAPLIPSAKSHARKLFVPSTAGHAISTALPWPKRKAQHQHVSCWCCL